MDASSELSSQQLSVEDASPTDISVTTFDINPNQEQEQEQEGEQIGGENSNNENENATGEGEQEENSEDEDKKESGDDGENQGEFDPMLFIELGDRVLIDSKKYKGRIVGKVYYRSEDLIRVLPDGASDQLYDFPRIFTDTEDRFADELGVEAYYVLDKHKFDTFTEQQDFHVDDKLETITADKEFGPTFTIKAIDLEEDKIEVEEEDKSTHWIEFGFVGIPIDLPFIILRRSFAALAEEGKKESEEAPEEDVVEGEVEEVLERPKIVIRPVGLVERPADTIYTEAKSADKYIPEHIQKSDALNNFMNMLDERTRNNPRAAREIRQLLETFVIMKNELIQYKIDGHFDRMKEVSAQSIVQLLEKVNVPLGRSVIDITKRILREEADQYEAISKEYFTGGKELSIYSIKKSIEELEGEKSELEEALEDMNEDDELYDDYTDRLEEIEKQLKDKQQHLNKHEQSTFGEYEFGEANENYYVQNDEDLREDMKERKTDLVSTQTAQGTLKRFWTNERSFMDTYMRPWLQNSINPPLIDPKEDTDTFRRFIPEIDEAVVPGGLNPTIKPSYIERNIFMSLQRILTTTYRKDQNRKVEFMPAEKATMRSYLLFPMEAANKIGTTRSGSLAIDSGRSASCFSTLREVFEDLGGVQEVTTSKTILALGVNRNTLGNIPITDYLEGIEIRGTGFGDAQEVLVELGLDKLELTPQILQVILTKLTAYQEQLKTTLAILREEIQKAGPVEGAPVIEQFFKDPTLLEDDINTQPLLLKTFLLYDTINPTLRQSDIGKIAFMLKKYQDYYLVTLGNQATYMAKERYRATRDLYLHDRLIQDALKNLIEMSGERPEPNPCVHVKDLAAIRAIRDEYERYEALIRFFAKFQGKRKDNWINCNICKRELLCIHERIKIQAFTMPKMKDVLQKEMFLNFSDGVFQGNFICKNCGQPMQELGFDTHLEYDDNGRPMMGRAVLVDKDALRMEEIETALGAPVGSAPAMDFGDDLQNSYYKSIKELVDRVGLPLDKEGYQRIIANVLQFVKKLTARKTYAEDKKKEPKKYPLDYDIFIGRYTVGAIGLFTLVEAQIHVPDYPVKFAIPGCVATFAGYPLVDDSEDTRGLEYIACAITSITRDEKPWSDTGYFGEKDIIKRRQVIVNYMKSIFNIATRSNITIKQKLSDKLTYIKEIFGAEFNKGRPTDLIPFGFLPLQTVKSDETIVKEVAENTKNSQVVLAKLWITYAHHIARKTAALVKGSPFIETVCCLGNIQRPGAFWKNISDMPELSPPQFQSTLYRQSTLKVHFEPRKQEKSLVETPKEFMYRLFLKVCFSGPRKGMQHESGLTNLCPWCGFQFPGNMNVIDMDTEGKAALESEKVDINAEDFQALLDQVHRNNLVPTHIVKEMTSVQDVMTALANMDPAPMEMLPESIEDWYSLIQETTRKLIGLPKDAEESDIAIALGDLAAAVSSSKEAVLGSDSRRSRILPMALNALRKLSTISWTNYFQIINAYIVTPIERILSDFQESSLKVPKELSYDLADTHIKDIQAILLNSTRASRAFRDKFKVDTASFAKLKLRRFLEQISETMKFQNKLRNLMLPGGSITLNYIQQAFLFGPLQELMNPNIVPIVNGVDTERYTAERLIVDSSAALILNVIVVLMDTFTKEQVAYDDEQIRTLLAIRKAKEEMNIVNFFDKMSEEERTVELTKKRLGMGRWARGGTKGIHTYDKEEYDTLRNELQEAGVDLGIPGIGPDQDFEFPDQQFDDMGFPIMEGDGEGYDQGGDGNDEDFRDDYD